MNWLFLYEMTDYEQHDQHVWDWLFWKNLDRLNEDFYDIPTEE